MTMYALLAEAMLRRRPTFPRSRFRLDPQARFNNGDPVLAQDVRHSFEMLSGKGASPSVQTGLAGIERVVVLDSRTVRFEFRDKSRDQIFIAGDDAGLQPQMGSAGRLAAGPAGHAVRADRHRFPDHQRPVLLIDKVDMPRRIDFGRNPRLLGARSAGAARPFQFRARHLSQLPGQAVAREAFKAGEFDLFKEYGARSWVRLHKGPKWDDGRIVKAALQTGFGQQMQSYQLNLRRPKFQDIRVREALGFTYDFDTINKTGLQARRAACSTIRNSARPGLPSPGELKLLEPFRAELPPRVFGPAFRAPRTDADPNGLRRNLLHARDLLQQAGWKPDRADGRLRNAKGEPFEFEYMTPRDERGSTTGSATGEARHRR